MMGNELSIKVSPFSWDYTAVVVLMAVPVSTSVVDDALETKEQGTRKA